MAEGPQRRIGDGHGFRSFLDSTGVWIAIAYGILFAVMILGGITYTRESSDRAARHAAAETQYHQCLQSIPFTIRTNRFIHGVRDVGAVLLLNSITMHEATPSGSPVYEAQEKNIRRLRRALREQRPIGAFPVSTRAECLAALRAALK